MPPSGCARTGSRTAQLPAQLPHREIVVPILMYHRINVSRPGTPSMERRPDGASRRLRPSDEWLKQHGYRTGDSARALRRVDPWCTPRAEADPAHVRRRVSGSVREREPGARPARHARDGIRHLRPGEERVSGVSDLAAAAPARCSRDRDRLAHRDARQSSFSVVPRLFRELVQSRLAFERRLRHPVQWLAYPRGRLRRANRAARAAGRLRPGGHDGARRRAVGPSSARLAPAPCHRLDRSRRARRHAQEADGMTCPDRGVRCGACSLDVVKMPREDSSLARIPPGRDRLERVHARARARVGPRRARRHGVLSGSASRAVRPRRRQGRAPDIGGLLPVFVLDRYEGLRGAPPPGAEPRRA